MNRYLKITLAALTVAMLYGCNNAEKVKSDASWSWLDERNVRWTYCGWQAAQKNTSVDRTPLKIGGQTIERGMGNHAAARMAIKLAGQGQRLEATVGADEEILSSGKSSMLFQVLGDGKVLWQSGTVKWGQKSLDVDIDIRSVKTLTLVVNHGRGGIDYDHADWAMAQISYQGVKPALVTEVWVNLYILTPKETSSPYIAGTPGNRNLAGLQSYVFHERISLVLCRRQHSCMHQPYNWYRTE